jgi:hypothetical protein
MRSLLLVLVLAGTASAEPAKIATRSWLFRQARAGFPILDSVDPDRGLAVIQHVTDSGDENAPEKLSAKLLCGDALAKQLPALKKAMKATYESSDTVSCQNGKDGTSSCSFHLAFEYSTSFTLVLKKNADGVLVPETVLELDAGSMNEEAYDEMDKWVSRRLQKVRATSCN